MKTENMNSAFHKMWMVITPILMVVMVGIFFWLDGRRPASSVEFEDLEKPRYDQLFVAVWADKAEELFEGYFNGKKDEVEIDGDIMTVVSSKLSWEFLLQSSLTEGNFEELAKADQKLTFDPGAGKLTMRVGTDSKTGEKVVYVPAGFFQVFIR